MALLKGVVYLDKEDLKTLIKEGSVIVDDKTIVYDENTIYVTPSNGEVLTGEDAPTEQTKGNVGQFYLDTTAKKLYQYVNKNEWQEVGGAKLISVNDSIIENNFEGVVQLTESQYLELISAGELILGGNTLKYNDKMLYVTTDTTDEKISELEEQIDAKADRAVVDQNTVEINDLQTTITELTPDVMRALKTPVSRPTKTELVAVDNTGSQTMLTVGDGLSVENGILEVGGGNDTSKYLHNIVIDAIFADVNTFTLSLQLLTDNNAEITNLTNLISALPNNKRIVANGYDGGLDIYAIKKSNNTIMVYSAGSGTCIENSIPTFDSIMDFTDYVITI